MVVDGGTPLMIKGGCSPVTTGTAAKLATIAVNAVAGPRSSTISIGGHSWKLAPNQTFSSVVWVPLTKGDFGSCMRRADLRSESLRLLANTTVPSVSSPGGLLNVTARIPLGTAGTRSGRWVIPPDAVPKSVAGLILQLSSRKTGVVRVRSGSTTVNVVVGKAIPASTLIVPQGALSWSSSNSAGPPEALLLGYITNRDDEIDGGALLNLLPRSVTLTGRALQLAGKYGIPAASSRIPATSVLALVSGPSSSVEDSLAAGRRTPAGSVTAKSNESVFRLSDAGTANFTSRVKLTVVGWLEGDVIRAADSADLALPGSPKPIAKPAADKLTFSGKRAFRVGETLIIGVSKFTPNGVVALVTGVVSSTKATVISYSRGALLDAFDELSLVSQLPAAPSPKSSDAPRTARSPDDQVASLSTSVGLNFSLSKSFSLSSSVSAAVSVDFAPSLTIAISVGTTWDFPTSVSIHYAADTTTSVTASVTASAGWSGTYQTDLGRLALTPIDLGWVVVVPAVAVTLAMHIGASASVTLSGTISEHAHDGMTLTAGGSRGFSYTGDRNNGFGAPKFESADPEVSIGASASATLSVEFILAIDDIAGPDAEASATLGISVNPGQTPAWEVTAGGDFSIGLDLDALNLGFLTEALKIVGIPTDPNWAIGHLGPYVLASGTGGSLGGPTGNMGGPSPIQGPTNGPGGPLGGPSETLTSAPSGASVTVSQGSPAPYGYRYAIQLTSFVPDSDVGIECYDSQDPRGFYYFILATNGSGDASTESYCYSATGPDYWVIAGGLASNEVRWGAPKTPPPAPGAAIEVGWSSSHRGWIYMTLKGFPAGSYVYSCDFGSGGDASFHVSTDGAAETFDNGKTCYDLESGDSVWVTIGSVTSNTIIVGGTPATKGYAETTGGVTNTWSDPSDAGGSEGPTIQNNETVVVACVIAGFAVADGNTSWYQIASTPWSSSYYASADAFYNDGRTSGSLAGTPLVDTSVPNCAPIATSPSTYAETTGGLTHTWTDFTDAGGTEGASIASNATVQITCAITGFKVADGNTWWYEIASSPWDNTYYASADAFYNNGATSGPLKGTPFVDPAVPNCNTSGIPETVGGPTHTWTDYSDAGGSQGQTIGSGATVYVSCAVHGFRVTDGNTWWYRIASSPWSNGYYASADAFYNSGHTSGPLKGTPFVDPAVPLC
jgi:hypothetical protein